MPNIKPLHKEQSGLVSITVTIIIMFILTLIVLGFSKLVRREQRQTLDRQLNTQAFYAAESGVNDATDALRTQPALEKTDCNPLPGYDNKLDGSDGTVSYSCLLIDPSPTSLEFTSVGTEQAQVFPIKSKNGAQPVNSITFSWQGQSTSSNDYNFNDCPPTGSFPAAWSGNCSTGILRLDLVPYAGAMSRNDLIAQSFTAFLYPQAGEGSIAYAGGVGVGGQGAIVAGNCNSSASPKVCSVTVSGLSGQTYYARMRSIYKPSAVTVTAKSGIEPIELVEAQAMVDSTGKANDILRRVQVRVPIASYGPFPEFALQSRETLCKRYAVSPPNTVVVQNPNAASAAACAVQ